MQRIFHHASILQSHGAHAGTRENAPVIPVPRRGNSTDQATRLAVDSVTSLYFLAIYRTISWLWRSHVNMAAFKNVKSWLLAV